MLEYYPLDIPVLARFLDNGDIAIGIINFTDEKRWETATLDAVGLGECTGKTLELTNVWTGEVTRPKNATIRAGLAPHACVVYRAKVVDL